MSPTFILPLLADAARSPIAPAAFDLLAPGTARVAVLVACRIGGLILTAPLLSHSYIPAQIKVALLVLLTVILQPVALASSAASGAPGLTPATILTETLIGFMLGFGGALILGAASMAGDYMAQHVGLAGASSFDPISNEASPIMAQFLSMFTLIVLVSTNLHYAMLGAVADSFSLIHPGGVGLDAGSGLAAGAKLGGELFALGLRMAAPVLVAGLLANVVLGLLSRAAPAMNILSLAFPFQIAIGLLVLFATLPVLGMLLDGSASWNTQVYERVLGAMTHGAPR